LLLSFALGLGAGLAAALGLERLDDTISSPEEIERATGLTTRHHSQGRRGSAVGQTEDRARRCRKPTVAVHLLQFTSDSGLPKSLLITSSGPSEGESVTALNRPPFCRARPSRCC
jgi:hypothetical protein